MSSTRAVITSPPRVADGATFEVRALLSHPMETGYRTGDDGARLARRLVRRFECRLDEDLLFSATLFAAVAANPYLAFWLRARRSGTLHFVWQGDGGFEHREARPLTVE